MESYTFHVAFVSPFLTQEILSSMFEIADVAPATQHIIMCFTLGFKDNKMFTSSSHPSTAECRKSLVEKSF